MSEVRIRYTKDGDNWTVAATAANFGGFAVATLEVV